MTHVSLFTGIGGIDLAAHWAGFRTVAMVERDPFCQQVLRANFKEVPIFDDVRTFDGSRYRGTDLVSAGFPCQPHSVAGSRKASGDERDLWGEVARVVGEARPRWFLGENVSGLLSSESGRFFGRVVDDLVQLGYRVGWCMYGASEAGAPHQRQRIFIVAYSALMQRDGGKTYNERATVPKPRDHRRTRVPIADTDSQSGHETSAPASPLGGGGRSWHDALRSDWGGIRDRDWDRVSLEPAIRGDDNGIPSRLDHEAKLRALGNAVVPQQVYPVLQAIADAIKENA